MEGAGPEENPVKSAKSSNPLPVVPAVDGPENNRYIVR